ncbi:MAG: ubiquinone/menaquinone biosynthesis methyltransferase [Bacteriodetes bacterium]|nr:ubiquinone/menaquinone biosynthesis methyltransferase [Bacteroidota bacterium]
MSEEVRQMFADISGEYDFMNTVLTLGMHHGWRRKAVRLSGAAQGMSVLDCASGTGDLAIEFKKAVGGKGKVLATDFCVEMLDYIKPKTEKLGLDIPFEFADAMNLQYADNTFDIASISYGIRNVDDPVVALQQMARVVKNNGKIVVIETGNPTGIMYTGYKLYNNYIVPVLGRMLAGNKDAYTYLPETASRFPFGNAFIELLNKTEMIGTAKAYPLFFGASYIYIATVRK